jgi:lysophospholipase L1-like esterase
MRISILLAGALMAPVPLSHCALANPQQPDLALHKPFVSSDPNTSGWNQGLTDGLWQPQFGQTFAAGGTDTFPKNVTVDLGAPQRLGYVATGVPDFGSTKTVELSLSVDGNQFTQIAAYVFSQHKAEYHLFKFAPATARYVRLTYADRYTESVGYPAVYVFSSELAAYAPGDTPPIPRLGLEPADVAAPKLGGDGQTDQSFLNAHESFLKRDAQGPIGLLFMGDSITHRWENAQDIWQKYFGQYNPADFGIEGDKTQNVLWRFENGELDNIHPKVVVLLIGTNNIGYPAADIVKADTKIVREIHRRIPNTKVLLLGILPRGADANDPVRAKIKSVNAELSKLDNRRNTRYLDFGDKLLDPNGNITKEMMPDSLHPTHEGYQIWADSMQPLLEGMMK